MDPDRPSAAYARSFLFDESRRPASKRQVRVKGNQFRDTRPTGLTRFEKDLASNPF
ncbi:hypothetical protein BGZ92_000301, partial [Podila epicladia]